MSVADRLASLTPEQRALFEALRQKQKAAAPAALAAPPPVARVSGPRGAGDWPLTFDQERLWFLSAMDPETTAFNMATANRLRGDLDVPALAAAVAAAVHRHGAWRTTFPVVDGRPVQRVAPELPVPLPVVDLSALPAERREAAALRLVDDDARRPFALPEGPLVRAVLARLSAREHLCILTVHHIVSDLVSFQIFWGELAVLYAAAARRLASPLAPPPVHFADFAVWQRRWLDGEVLRAELDWWRGQLDGFPLVLDLPADRPRPLHQAGRGGRHPVLLDAARTEALRALAKREGVTRFMVVAALSAALFHRLSGQERLITGTLNANRSRPEVESIFGFFLTQLPLAVDLSGDPTVRELLGRVRTVALGAFTHQHLPFGKLVEALHPERDTARQPVVQALVQLLDATGGVAGGARLGDLEVEGIDVYDGNARYDLMLVLFEGPETIAGPLEYDADLFDRTTVARMADLLGALFDAAAADPGRRLSSLPSFSPAARHQVLVEWNDTALPGDAVPVLDAFAAQAARTPEAVAWEGEAWRLTYAELDARSNRLARYLRRLGIGAEELVGLYLERTAEVPVAVLGVLKSGGAYLPLDLSHPAERRAFMLEEARARVVLTQERLLESLPRTRARPVLLDTEWDEIARESAEPLPAHAAPGNRAYVIYTSGSTGRPKGVDVSRFGLAHLLRAMGELFEVGPGGSMPGLTTLAFDVSVPEIYMPMMSGGRTPLLTRETALDGVALSRALERSGATVLQATPAGFRMLLDSGWKGDPDLLLLTGAEPLTRDLADRLLPVSRGLVNLFGPTEITVWATAWRATAEGPVSVGRPLAEVRVYLLDRAFAPVPLGAVGEVYLGGLGVARGYFARPELTAERFVPDPVSGRAGERLYRTGDLARQRPDGLLDFLGRADFQVKMRGFRIELGEIEAVLRRHPAVSEAVVLLREDRPGDQRLAAYLGLAPGAAAPPDAELKLALSERLPEYMVPSAFVALPELPRNANRKVDRKALAAIRPDWQDLAPDGGRVAPRTPVEEELAGLWATVLDVREVGAFDDFFALGGHSLLATQLVLRVREAFGVELPLRAVFQAPTLAAQAGLVERGRGEGKGKGKREDSPRTRPIERVPRGGGDLPLSFAQERLWFLDQLTPGSPAYNVPAALSVRGPLDAAALERAFATVVERHEALRTRFPSRGERPVQEIAPADPDGWSLAVEDLSGRPDAAAEAVRLAAEEALRPFDLARGPVLRTRLLRLAPEEHVLLLTVHHIAADLWGAGLLIREVAQAYAGGPLPALPGQYADFAVWQRRWLDGAELERQLGFWRRELAGAPPALDLPTDRPRPAVESFRGASLPVALGRGPSAALDALARERGATPFMAVTAALAVLLSRWTGQDDVVLGSPIANRPRPELEGLIGMFVNTLALRVRLTGAATFGEILDRVRRGALEAFEHQDLPFEKLVEELATRRDLSRHPVFQAVLAFQNVRLEEVDLPGGLALAPLEVESATTKFDLTLTLFEGEEGLAGRLEYASDLFDAATLERLVGHLRRVMEAVTAAPEAPLAGLPLLSGAERRQLLEWGDAPFLHPRDADLHGLVAAQAARTPDAVAVVYGGEELTYAGLMRRAAAVAGRLLRLGLPPESRVAVAAERSPGLVPALLGILQAGCAYVPLDLEHPRERLAYVLADAGAAALVAGPAVLDALPPELRRAGLPLVSTDEADGGEAAPPALPEVGPDRLAYVIYTSGSTGAPKGVAATHRNVVRLVRDSGCAGAGAEETWLQLGALAFDASTLEVWAPLTNGGRLVLFPGRRAALDEIGEAIARHGVTSLWLTAGLFHQMVDERPEALRPLRRLLAGGDVLSPDHARRALTALPHGRLVDGYGPTENTTFTACHAMTLADAEAGRLAWTVPIGRPIGGTRIHVTDSELRLVPEGVWGELLAGGDGVARGYLGRPDLTAERFIPDPFGPEPGGRLYRTGDLVRWRAGVLEFLGRRDGQVKVRGFRVEIGEIEAALAAAPAVGEAAVLLREDRPGDRRLVAYVTPAAGAAAPPEAGELRRHLASRLPEPMVPSAFVVLDRLQLTANGKVDRRALPAPGAAEGEGYVPPATPVEEHLAQVCAEVLGRERVGMHDNFFALGGHSLLATQLVARLRERYGIEVPLQMVFDAADLRDLADRLVERELAAEVGDLSPEELRALLAEDDAEGGPGL